MSTAAALTQTLWGYYVFADYCNGQFWAIAPSDVGGWQVITLSNLSNLQYTSFGENYQGELFVTAHSQGKIYRVTETTGTPFEIIALVQSESCPGAADGAVTLSWPPVNEPITLLWDNLETSPTLDSLVTGTYCATVYGGNGCQTSICLGVGQSLHGPRHRMDQYHPCRACGLCQLPMVRGWRPYPGCGRSDFYAPANRRLLRSGDQ